MGSRCCSFLQVSSHLPLISFPIIGFVSLSFFLSFWLWLTDLYLRLLHKLSSCLSCLCISVIQLHINGQRDAQTQDRHTVCMCENKLSLSLHILSFACLLSLRQRCSRQQSFLGFSHLFILPCLSHHSHTHILYTNIHTPPPSSFYINYSAWICVHQWLADFSPETLYSGRMFSWPNIDEEYLHA